MNSGWFKAKIYLFCVTPSLCNFKIFQEPFKANKSLVNEEEQEELKKWPNHARKSNHHSPFVYPSLINIGWLTTARLGRPSLPKPHPRAPAPPVGGRPGLLWAALDRPGQSNRKPAIRRTPKHRNGAAMPSPSSCKRTNRCTGRRIGCCCSAPASRESRRLSSRCGYCT